MRPAENVDDWCYTLPVLSHFQAATAMEARSANQTEVSISLDLGLTVSPARLDTQGVQLRDQSIITWEDLETIHADQNNCYALEHNQLHLLRHFVQSRGHTYSLLPTRDAPALIISGFNMHRIRNTTPMEAANQMVSALSRLRGTVLDTTTGLGYTAIAASKTARVVTFEKDPMCREMSRWNPWSRSLFNNPRITCSEGDSSEEVQKLPDRFFSAIIHDPPSISLAGDLYSGAFYEQALRILQPAGQLFHYIGDPHSRLGASVTRGVVKRLHHAGFARVVSVAKAYGVVAFKNQVISRQAINR